VKALLLHHLGVPCVTRIRKSEESISQTDIIYFLNPAAIVRYEPDGAVITPPILYSSFIYADADLAKLLRQKFFPGKGLPEKIISLLLENRVISEERTISPRYREMYVETKDLPTQVLLDVTSACNCNCITCYHKADLDGHTPPLADVLYSIEKLKELGISLFEVTGGEPFLRKDLCDILDRLTELHLHFYVVTNGEFLKDADERLIAALKNGLGLAVSLDGVGETHDRVRQRPGLYDKLIAGLDVMSEAGVQIYLISTLNNENMGCISEMIAVAKRYGTTIHLRPTIRTGAAIMNNLESRNLSDVLKEFLGHPNVRNGLLRTKKTIPEARYYGCGIRKRISVNSFGVLFPCVMDRDRQLVNISKLDQRDFVQKLRIETETFLNRNDLCRTCEANKGKYGIICGGFCRFSMSHRKGVIS